MEIKNLLYIYSLVLFGGMLVGYTDLRADGEELTLLLWITNSFYMMGIFFAFSVFVPVVLLFKDKMEK